MAFGDHDDAWKEQYFRGRKIVDRQGLNMPQGTFDMSAEELTKVIDDLEKAANNGRGALELFLRTFGKAPAVVEEALDSVIKAIGVSKEFEDEIDKITKQMGAAKSLRDLRKERYKEAQALKETGRTLDDAAEAIERLGDGAKKAVMNLIAMDKALINSMATQDTYRQAILDSDRVKTADANRARHQESVQGMIYKGMKDSDNEITLKAGINVSELTSKILDVVVNAVLNEAKTGGDIDKILTSTGAGASFSRAGAGVKQRLMRLMTSMGHIPENVLPIDEKKTALDQLFKEAHGPVIEAFEPFKYKHNEIYEHAVTGPFPYQLGNVGADGAGLVIGMLGKMAVNSNTPQNIFGAMMGNFDYSQFLNNKDLRVLGDIVGDPIFNDIAPVRNITEEVNKINKKPRSSKKKKDAVEHIIESETMPDMWDVLGLKPTAYITGGVGAIAPSAGAPPSKKAAKAAASGIISSVMPDVFSALGLGRGAWNAGMMRDIINAPYEDPLAPPLIGARTMGDVGQKYHAQGSWINSVPPKATKPPHDPTNFADLGSMGASRWLTSFTPAAIMPPVQAAIKNNPMLSGYGAAENGITPQRSLWGAFKDKVHYGVSQYATNAGNFLRGPGLGKLQGVLGEQGLGGLPGVGGIFSSVGKGLGAAGKIAKFAKGGPAGIIAAGVVGIGKTIAGIFKFLAKHSPVMKAIMDLMNLFFTLFFMPIGNALGSILLPLMEGLIDWVLKWNDLWTDFTWDKFGGLLWDMFSALIKWIVSIPQSIFNLMLDILDFFWSGIPNILADFFESIGWGGVATFFRVYGDIMGKAIDFIRGVVNNIFNSIKSFFNDPVGVIRSAVKGIINGAGDWLGDTWNNLTSWIPSFATGGIIPGSPGGTIVRVAEAGQTEVIVPLSEINSIGGQPIVINISGDIYGISDLESKIETVINRVSNRSAYR